MFWAIYPFLLSPFFFFFSYETLSPLKIMQRLFEKTTVVFVIVCFLHFLPKDANFLFIFICLCVCVFLEQTCGSRVWNLYVVPLGKGSGGNCFCYYSFTNHSLWCKSSLCGQQPPWGFYSYALSATEQSRGKTNICCGQGCFQCGLEPLNDSHGQFPKRLRGTNTSSFTKDKPFWRGPLLSALTVNTTVSGTNVTSDW